MKAARSRRLSTMVSSDNISDQWFIMLRCGSQGADRSRSAFAAIAGYGTEHGGKHFQWTIGDNSQLLLTHHAHLLQPQQQPPTTQPSSLPKDSPKPSD
jgi:hypothetical protein